MPAAPYLNARILAHIGPLTFRQRWLLFGYIAFIMGFFALASSPHRTIFYLGIMLPMLLLCTRAFLGVFFGSGFIRLLLLFMVYITASALWADPPSVKLLVKHARRGIYILTFIGATAYLGNIIPRFTETLLRALTVACGLFAIVCMVWWYTRNPFPETRLFALGRLSNPIHCAIAVIAFHLPLFIAYLSGDSKRTPLEFSLAAPALLFGILTQTRGALLAMAVTVAILLLVHRKRRSLLVVCVLSACALLWLHFDPGAIARLSERGTSFRMEIWKDALFQLSECGVLFGCGMQKNPSFHIFNDTHSLYVSALYFGGIAGLLLYLGLLGKGIFDGFQEGGPGSHWAWILIFVSLNCVVYGNKILISPNNFWLYFWLPVAAITANRLQPRLAGVGAAQA